MTQKTELVITANATQATAQIAALDAQVKQTTASAVRMGGTVDKAVGPTRNLGQAALEGSRALEDLQYGIGGVVNNIPSLVMAIGGGAGLTAAISLTAVGINQLVKNMTAVDPATKEATKAAAEHVKGLRDEIAGLAKDLRVLQVGSERAAMEIQAEAVKRAADAARTALDPLGGVERFERLKDRTDLPLTIKENVDKARKAVTELDQELSKLAGMRRIQLEKAAQRETDLIVDRANAEEALLQTKNEKFAKIEEDAAKTRFDVYVAGLDAEDKALREVAKARAADAKKQRADDARELQRAFREMDQDKKAIQKAELDAKRKHDREIMRAEQEKQRALKEAAKSTADYQMNLATSVAGNLLSTSMDYMEAKIKGEKDAEVKALASFLSTTGQQIAASGLRGILEGAIISSNPITPGAGAGMIATGAVAVAAGLAMAGGGAAISSSIPTSTGAGAGGGSGSRDTGASPSRGGGNSGSGGPLIINVSYGAGGPLPEDVGREIARAMGGANRRSGR